MLYTHWVENNGGYNDGDPPLTIPNREVKPISADDTAIPSGKVGSRQLCESIQETECSFFLCADVTFVETYPEEELYTGGYRLAAVAARWIEGLSWGPAANFVRPSEEILRVFFL